MLNSHNQERIVESSFSPQSGNVASLLEVEFLDENIVIDLMGKTPDKVNFITSLGSLSTVNIKKE